MGPSLHSHVLTDMLKLLQQRQSVISPAGADQHCTVHLQTDPGRRPTPAMLAAHPFVAGAQLPAGLLAAITATANMQTSDEQTGWRGPPIRCRR